MYVQLMPGAGRARLKGLREYSPGSYPVPGWNYTNPNLSACCGSGRKRRRGLGDIILPPPGSNLPPFDPITGMPTDPNAVPVSIYPVAPGAGGDLTSAQLATIAQMVNAPNVIPAVSASTLLAAAGLPNAPNIVKQAAAAYKSANPFGSLLSGSLLAGIPNYLLLAGVAVGLVAVSGGMSGGARRR